MVLIHRIKHHTNNLWSLATCNILTTVERPKERWWEPVGLSSPPVEFSKCFGHAKPLKIQYISPEMVASIHSVDKKACVLQGFVGGGLLGDTWNLAKYRENPKVHYRTLSSLIGHARIQQNPLVPSRALYRAAQNPVEPYGPFALPSECLIESYRALSSLIADHHKEPYI